LYAETASPGPDLSAYPALGLLIVRDRGR
jgi:hypothetical protein